MPNPTPFSSPPPHLPTFLALLNPLLDSTTTLEDAITLVYTLIKLTQPERKTLATQKVIYSATQSLLLVPRRLASVSSTGCPPAPDPLIRFLTRTQRLKLSFGNVKPIGLLIEVYTSLFVSHESEILPHGRAHTKEEMEKGNGARGLHLEAMRKMHEAMREWDGEEEAFSVRTWGSLMRGYARGGGFEEVEGVWRWMCGEEGKKGRGLDQRAVSVVSRSPLVARNAHSSIAPGSRDLTLVSYLIWLRLETVSRRLGLLLPTHPRHCRLVLPPLPILPNRTRQKRP